MRKSSEAAHFRQIGPGNVIAPGDGEIFQDVPRLVGFLPQSKVAGSVMGWTRMEQRRFPPIFPAAWTLGTRADQ